MKRKWKSGFAALLAVMMILTAMPATAFGADIASTAAAVDAAVLDTAAYVYKTVKSPQVGSVGGEWAVLGLARSGYKAEAEYYLDYYKTVENYVKSRKGVLHDKKYTEYSRLILALTSIGKDPRNVAGYNLLTPLGDFDKTIWQGINGPIWALIALDCGNYDMPKNKDASTQATREMYVDEILKRQLSDGGFSLFGGTPSADNKGEVSDPDITGMALQALAKYQNRADVKKVTDQALALLSKIQEADGGYASYGSTNSESVVQVIVALTELGISLDDSRFVKNGKTLMDNLMKFYIKGEGFLHTAGGDGSNMMATEQAFYGLVAAQRARLGKNSLYRMSDAISMGAPSQSGGSGGAGLEGKNSDVKARDISAPGKTFADISSHKNQVSIEALLARGIISGYSDNTFRPEATMTRGEFAAIVVNALGLTPKASDKFKDVPAGEWYGPFVGTASSYGIVSGTSPSTFAPEGTITKQEAASMIANAAKLCGMDTALTDSAARDVISQFSDYTSSESWARQALAFCYKSDILSQSDALIQPNVSVKRYEIAEMLYRMLNQAKLLK